MKQTMLFFLLLLTGFSALAADVYDLTGNEAKQALARNEATIKAKPNDFEALKAAGIILHQMSRTVINKELLETAENYLKQAHNLQPNDPETTAWLGSVITMKARLETNPGQQLFLVKSGTRMLDKAIQQAPDNTVVRLTRAYNSLELPAFLKRTNFAVEDFNYYLQQCTSKNCPEHHLADARAGLAKAEKIIAGN